MAVVNLNQYKFIRHRRKDGSEETIAISTFAGKIVRGKAICAADDKFNEYNGQVLAAARCNERVADKRHKRAKMKLREAEEAVAAAARQYDKMKRYYEDSYVALVDARKHTKQVKEEL